MLKNALKPQTFAHVAITQRDHRWTAQLTVFDDRKGTTPTIQTWTGYPKYVEQRLARALDKFCDTGVIYLVDPLKTTLAKVKP